MNLYLWDSCGMSKMKEPYKPDWPFNSPHWSPHKSFTFSSGNLVWNQHIFFLSLRHYLRMYRYWKRKFLLAPSWEWKGFVSDRFLLFCETNISNLFLKLCNNFLVLLLCFLCTSLSAGNARGYTCVKTWHMGPKQHNRVLGTPIWVQFKGWITLSNGAIAILWISNSKMYGVIYQIEVYLVDSVIWPSHNWSLYVGLYFI